jgi:hypothetical protein
MSGITLHMKGKERNGAGVFAANNWVCYLGLNQRLGGPRNRRQVDFFREVADPAQSFAPCFSIRSPDATEST